MLLTQGCVIDKYLPLLACLQGVDIFSKDWLFVPIHDHLHWSLVLVAHPGVLPGTDPERDQCIIHFDSMEGGEPHWQSQLCSSSRHDRVALPVPKHKGKRNERRWFCAICVCNVHLPADGMPCCAGGHSTTVVTKAMRQYLQNEWERLVGGLLSLCPLSS